MSGVNSSTKHLLTRGATYLFGGAAMALAAPPMRGMDPVELVLLIILLVLSLGVHEAAHGWVAWKCGDSTAKDLGRITLNPIPHIDPFMTLILPAMLFYFTGGRMMFGGAKPVPVSFHRLRHPWRDMSLVAIAGPASNLILAVLFMVAFHFVVAHGLYNGAAGTANERLYDLLPRVLWGAASFNVILALFNMVPIPPLDGSRVMAWLLPESLRSGYVGLERFGMLIVFGMLYVPMFSQYLFLTRSTILGGMSQVVEVLIPLQGR
jgi:Zn-dependent protease